MGGVTPAPRGIASRSQPRTQPEVPEAPNVPDLPEFDFNIDFDLDLDLGPTPAAAKSLKAAADAAKAAAKHRADDGGIISCLGTLNLS